MISELLNNHLSKPNTSETDKFLTAFEQKLKENSHLKKMEMALLIGEEIKKGFQAGKLKGNQGLVWMLIGCSVEIALNKKIGQRELERYVNIYELLHDKQELTEKISFSIVEYIFKTFTHDEDFMIMKLINDAIQNKYSLAKIKNLYPRYDDQGNWIYYKQNMDSSSN